MKRNELVEIKQLDIAGLLKKAEGIKKEILDLVIDKNMRKLKDLKTITKKRKDIAQIFTILKQKQILEQLTKENVGEKV